MFASLHVSNGVRSTVVDVSVPRAIARSDAVRPPKIVRALNLSVVAGVMLWASAVSAQSLEGGEIQHTFFVGAFFDLNASPQSHLVKYLIAPHFPRSNGHWRGTELTPTAAETLRQTSAFVSAAHLDFSGAPTGNPVTIYVSRAQHETVTMTFPDHTAYNTVISVAVALDIFTDRAAYLDTYRLESLYSRLQVVEQPFLTDAPLDDARLQTEYERLLAQAITEVAARAAEDLSTNRSRASAVFQINRFALPKTMPPELDKLVEAALSADHRPSDESERQREITRLSNEFEHTVHQFVLAELRRRNLSNIALLPPPNPWVDASVLPRLKERLPVFESATMVSKIDVGQMNGYTVTAGILQASTTTTESRAGLASRVFAAQMAARIFRSSRDGGGSQMMPVSVPDLAAKTAIGSGGEGYVDATEFLRPTTREIAFTALRRSAQDLAPKLVDLMVKTTNEINP